MKGIEMAAKTSKKLAGVASQPATKKTVKKSAASKKSATAPKEAAESKKACCKKGKCSDTKLTRVIVKFDAGWETSSIFASIGAGLNWQKGVVMQCVGDDEWLWNSWSPRATYLLRSCSTTKFGARERILSSHAATQSYAILCFN
ncbi:MAG: hypothetical protein ACLUKN_09570 [Bacilli bacterium]